MGHANSAAALRYQHATASRDRVIADALSALAMPTGPTPGICPENHPVSLVKSRSERAQADWSPPR